MQELGLPSRFDAALASVPEDLRARPVGLAVSGGSDSTALLHLGAAWARRTGAALAIFTVDHRLRAASAAEAASVADACRTLGLTHRTLVWDTPVARQSAARRARHALLAGALKDVGGSLLLTGHTATDQAETVLMRIRQGSGWYGLAGMRRLSLSPVWPEGEGVWIARPLLAETRETLRDWLAREGAGWIDDPSNENPAFERVRTRRLVAGGDSAVHCRTLACQQGFARLRAIEDAHLARWLGNSISVRPDGQLGVRLQGLGPERAARALGVLIQCVAGRETPPRAEALARLAARCLAPNGFRGATLGGVRLRPGKGGLVLAPEASGGAAPGPATARITAFRRLFINSAQELGNCSGNESFLQGLMPIFSGNTVSAVRDLP